MHEAGANAGYLAVPFPGKHYGEKKPPNVHSPLPKSWRAWSSKSTVLGEGSIAVGSSPAAISVHGLGIWPF